MLGGHDRLQFSSRKILKQGMKLMQSLDKLVTIASHNFFIILSNMKKNLTLGMSR